MGSPARRCGTTDSDEPAGPREGTDPCATPGRDSPSAWAPASGSRDVTPDPYGVERLCAPTDRSSLGGGEGLMTQFPIHQAGPSSWPPHRGRSQAQLGGPERHRALDLPASFQNSCRLLNLAGGLPVSTGLEMVFTSAVDGHEVRVYAWSDRKGRPRNEWLRVLSPRLGQGSDSDLEELEGSALVVGVQSNGADGDVPAPVVFAALGCGIIPAPRAGIDDYGRVRPVLMDVVTLDGQTATVEFRFNPQTVEVWCQRARRGVFRRDLLFGWLIKPRAAITAGSTTFLLDRFGEPGPAVGVVGLGIWRIPPHSFYELRDRL